MTLAVSYYAIVYDLFTPPFLSFLWSKESKKLETGHWCKGKCAVGTGAVSEKCQGLKTGSSEVMKIRLLG